MAQSKIEWTEMTWNPTSGCNKVSAGCKFCYAEVMSNRLHAMGLEKYRNNFLLTLHEDVLSVPYSWRKPKLVFVNSMSDLFHEEIPLVYIQKVFEVMNNCPNHTFQILTKRSKNLLKLAPFLSWSNNIWMGVSVENESMMHRIDDLKNTKAQIKFLSLEPLLGPLPKLDLDEIDWVIVGGESGAKARPMKEDWVLQVKDQCQKTHVPFFFKQWGGKNKKKNGRLLQGKTYSGVPIKGNYLFA